MHETEGDTLPGIDADEPAAGNAIPATPIIDVDMSPRAYDVLSNLGCRTLQDVAVLSRQKLSRQPNCGETLIAEVEGILRRYKVTLIDAPTLSEQIARLQKKRGEFLREARSIEKELEKLRSRQHATRERNP